MWPPPPADALSFSLSSLILWHSGWLTIGQAYKTSFNCYQHFCCYVSPKLCSRSQDLNSGSHPWQAVRNAKVGNCTLMHPGHLASHGSRSIPLLETLQCDLLEDSCLISNPWHKVCTTAIKGNEYDHPAVMFPRENWTRARDILHHLMYTWSNGRWSLLLLLPTSSIEGNGYSGHTREIPMTILHAQSRQARRPLKAKLWPLQQINNPLHPQPALPTGSQGLCLSPVPCSAPGRGKTVPFCQYYFTSLIHPWSHIQLLS